MSGDGRKRERAGAVGRLRVGIACIVLCGAFASCSADEANEAEPSYPADCSGLEEAEAFDCLERRFWHAFQTDIEGRPDVFAIYDAVLAEHEGANDNVAEGHGWFRRGQLAMAIAIEDPDADQLFYIQAVLDSFDKAGELDPDNRILVSWQASMEIALAVVTRNFDEATRLYDEAEERIMADPLGNVPSISGTAVGLPMDTGVPQRITELMTEWECSGVDWCEENTDRAPWARPGMSYHIAEHLMRIGDAEGAREWLQLAADAPGFEDWPYRWIVDDALADLDGAMEKFTSLPDSEPAFDIVYANQDYGCVFCHAK